MLGPMVDICTRARPEVKREEFDQSGSRIQVIGPHPLFGSEGRWLGSMERAGQITPLFEHESEREQVLSMAISFEGICRWL